MYSRLNNQELTGSTGAKTITHAHGAGHHIPRKGICLRGISFCVNNIYTFSNAPRIILLVILFFCFCLPLCWVARAKATNLSSRRQKHKTKHCVKELLNISVETGRKKIKYHPHYKLNVDILIKICFYRLLLSKLLFVYNPNAHWRHLAGRKYLVIQRNEYPFMSVNTGILYSNMNFVDRGAGLWLWLSSWIEKQTLYPRFLGIQRIILTT